MAVRRGRRRKQLLDDLTEIWILETGRRGVRLQSCGELNLKDYGMNEYNIHELLV